MNPLRLANTFFQKSFLAVIRAYQLTLSPILGNQCRFQPTCSRYGYEAIATHGPWRGGWMTLARIARCNPFSAGGFDPVPPCNHSTKETTP
jgi:uncharacterized protein